MFCVVCALAGGLSGAAHADDSIWHVDLLVGTSAPVSAGARAQLELPGRVRTHLGVGWLLDPYLRLINDVAVQADWLDEPTADVVEASLDGVLMLETSVGWRPLASHGLFFGGGYTAGLASGSERSARTVAQATGESLPRPLIESDLAFDLRSTAHLVTADIGWELVLAERLVIDLAIGGAVTVASVTQVVPMGLGEVSDYAQERVATLIEVGETRIDEVVVDVVKTPTISLHAGFRFM